METKLENLIEKLKKEGVEEAKKESERLIKEAQQKAAKLIKKAEGDAASLIDSAKQKADEFHRNGEIAIQQAARDSELAFKSRINEMLDSIFKREVGTALKPEFMKDMIIDLLKQWKEERSFEITLSETDQKQVEKLLFAGVHKSLENSITLEGSDEISGGFRIGLKDDNVYYDFTDDAISGILKAYINPRIREILDKDNG